MTATVPSWDRENGTLALQLAGQDGRTLRRPVKVVEREDQSQVERGLFKCHNLHDLTN